MCIKDIHLVSVVDFIGRYPGKLIILPSLILNLMMIIFQKS